MFLMAEFRLSAPLLIGIRCLMLADAAQQNNFTQPVYFPCPHNQHISTVKSEHSNDYEDRMWAFECRALEGAQFSSCRWFNKVNPVDGKLDFRCRSDNGVITGVSSSFYSRYDDRRHSYRCCDLVGKSLDECQLTGYINDYDKGMDYTAPAGNVIVRFKSANHNSFQDRRWQVEICTVK